MNSLVASSGALLLLALCGAPVAAQRPTVLSQAVREFVAVDAAIVALRGVRVIDGTGTPPLDNQTVLIRNGVIASVGPAADLAIPQGAQILDLRSHTVIPGIIGMHNHLFGTDFNASRAAALYLAAGVTTIRTTGTFDANLDIDLKGRIDHGITIGPRLHLTSPFLTGPHGPSNMVAASTPEQARQFVNHWADRAVGWIKVYTTIRRAELAAVIAAAHRNGVRVTGHLCAVTALEAAELGIDNIEHVVANSDFDPQKKPDECSSWTLPADVGSEAVQAAIRTLVASHVAITSTLTATEILTPDRIPSDPRVSDLMSPAAQEAAQRTRARVDTIPRLFKLLEREMAFHRAFVQAGGLLVAGTDPVGAGVIPGLADQRNYELLLEAGFKPEHAVRIMTANGAALLGVDSSLGTLQPGKIADLVVLRGDPTSNRMALREVALVFKDGVGYDSPSLMRSIRSGALDR